MSQWARSSWQSS